MASFCKRIYRTTLVATSHPTKHKLTTVYKNLHEISGRDD